MEQRGLVVTCHELGDSVEGLLHVSSEVSDSPLILWRVHLSSLPVDVTEMTCLHKLMLRIEKDIQALNMTLCCFLLLRGGINFQNFHTSSDMEA